MGKSEITSIPLKNDAHFPSTGKGLHIEMAENEQERKELPEDVEVFSNQVGGHVNDTAGLGMLKVHHAATILKPIINKECGERETLFYKKLNDTVDPTLLQLKELVPRYYGNTTLKLGGKEVEYLILEDLTKDFKEPCVIDIKIGRRSWDPTASLKKIQSEDSKYKECKRDLGFCIPGIQIYNIHSGKMHKFNKDFGKKLNKETAEDALKMFLNADGGAFSRSLIVQILAVLWQIQSWTRNQRRLRLYSSSILISYDARRLREHIKRNLPSTLKLQRKNSLYRPLSMAVLNNGMERIPTGFSGQFSKEGPILKPPTSLNKLINFEIPSPRNNNNTWQKSIHTLKRTHSFQNNYDKEVQNKKQDYTFILDELCCEQKSELWASVKMIDFAHVFPAENCDIDRNYLEGIESLVKIFEDFLIESE